MPKIIVQVGQARDIPLKTNAGTGFTWVLTELPAGLSLMDVSTASSAKLGVVGGPITETFTFVGLTKGKGKLTFALIRPWVPIETADTRSFDVVIVENVEEAMADEAGHDNYLPIPVIACEGENKDQLVISSTSRCILKYGAIPPDTNCQLLYGIPITALYAVHPHHHGPIARYMVRPPTTPEK
jgi:predicted secreted protein